MLKMLLTLALLAANISQVNFDILNNSKQTISHVWIAKHGSDQWGKDFLERTADSPLCFS
jgi:hypothetical protein